jgi:hypothetical protein
MMGDLDLIYVRFRIFVRFSFCRSVLAQRLSVFPLSDLPRWYYDITYALGGRTAISRRCVFTSDLVPVTYFACCCLGIFDTAPKATLLHTV